MPVLLIILAQVCAVQWEHPAGIVTESTIEEVRERIAAYDWAQAVYATRKEIVAPWLDASYEELRRVFPRRRGNVYHNFSCPKDRHALTFDPFQPDTFACPICGAHYASETDAGIYPPEHRYHGTMYDGWACRFYQNACSVAADLGLMARVEGKERYTERGIELLMLYAEVLEGLPTDVAEDHQFSRILTYHREGDNKILYDLARAYELLRGRMTEAQRARFEKHALTRMLEDLMLEPIYTYNHNNVYQWHRTIIQTALALEREDLIDWSFGYGPFAPANEPEHRSIRRLVATHFNPDGAYWELCSGYHLYPLHHFCELAVLSHHLTQMDSVRFPARQYDLTDRASAAGKVLYKALQWFISLAMPDRSMPVLGDSTISRAGMDSYFTTAEVGYRFFDIRAVGDYDALRDGQRSWAGLLHGAPEIVQRYTPFTSSYLSSGWVALRNEWQGNRVWVGLNALIAGGGHQHADRLTLVSYSHGKLLALEKATPYNESVTRELGTLSPSHNTVTVNRRSQKQGEALCAEETPRVAYFFAGPVAKFAELHGDNLYPEANTYRRSVVLIEDIIVDFFRVEGGGAHDWMAHHAGPAPRFSMAMEDAAFEPVEWLYNGTGRVVRGSPAEAWDVRWRVDEVTSRLTMMGAEGTEAYGLETYPVDNAFVTPEDPPCQTLCVRRTDDAPFLAVWDAWRDTPNLRQVERGDEGESLLLTTASHTYHLCFGAGASRFQDGVSLESDAALSLARDAEAVLFVGGTRLALTTPEGLLQVTSDAPGAVSAEWEDGVITLETAGDIQYDTYAGQDHYRDIPSMAVDVDGGLWRVRKMRHRFAGYVQ